jgi:hypothetical protein
MNLTVSKINFNPNPKSLFWAYKAFLDECEKYKDSQPKTEFLKWIVEAEVDRKMNGRKLTFKTRRMR